MKKIHVSLTLLFALTASHSSAVTISFEDQAAAAFPSYFSGSGPVQAASMATSQYHALGVDFSGVAYIVLGVGHATSGAIGLGGVNASGVLDYSGSYFTATFDGVTDFVSIRGDLSPAGGNITLRAFDSLGSLLAFDTETDGGGTTLSISASGIHRIEFTGNGTTALDDLTFDTPTRGTSVPDGGSTVLLLGATLSVMAGIRRFSSSK